MMNQQVHLIIIQVNKFKTLQDTCRNTGTTVIVITHNSAIAQMADRVIKINDDKKLRSIEVNKNPLSNRTY